MTELEALYKIRDGEALRNVVKDGEKPTRLMVLAVLTHHKERGWQEIPAEEWTDWAAALATSKNFRALKGIPEEKKIRIIPAIVEASGTITRKELDEFIDVINQQPAPVLEKMIRRSRDMERFIRPEVFAKLNAPGPSKVGGMQKKTDRISPEYEKDMFLMDFSGLEEFSDPDELTPEAFLSLSSKEQTREKLNALLESDHDFPGDFIRRLSIPNRNAAFYKKEGDESLFQYWKSRIIPYLDLETCRMIAGLHPEGSTGTPFYLTKDAVTAFWNKKRQLCTKRQMTDYFLSFPQEVLSPFMEPDLISGKDVLLHAPMVLKGTELARKHFNRHPADILDASEYQTPERVIAYGVPLNSRTIRKIADPELREKVAVALGIRTEQPVLSPV